MKFALAGGILITARLLSWAWDGRAQAQSAPGATLSGTITANRDYALSEASGNHIPALRAVRVRARDDPWPGGGPDISDFRFEILAPKISRTIDPAQSSLRR